MLSITRHLFGYDFFISYSHGDAKTYAVQLHEVLSELGYRTFLDNEELHAGQELTPAITSALRRSTALIAIVSPIALDPSSWVEKEVRLFSETKRTVIAISLWDDIAAHASSSTLIDALGERLRLTEAVVGENTQPSQQTVTQLAKALNTPRIERRRTYALMGMSIVFATLAASALWFGIAEKESRQKAEKEAIHARKQTATRYAIAADAALSTRPEEAIQLARKAMDVFRNSGDPLVAAAVGTLHDVVQSIAGQSIGVGQATLSKDNNTLWMLFENGELWSFSKPGLYGLTKANQEIIPAELIGKIYYLFTIDNEAYIEVGRSSEEFEINTMVIRVSDWQIMHRIAGEMWDLDLEYCTEGGKLAVVRGDIVELLDLRQPNKTSLTLPIDDYDAFVQFSADCRFLSFNKNGKLVVADTISLETRSFVLPEHSPIDIQVSEGDVLLLDTSSKLWRLTSNEPDLIGSIFESHNDLISAQGAPFDSYNLEANIVLAKDLDTVLATYRIMMDDNGENQGIGMASVFSLAGKHPPWTPRQNNPKMFGRYKESSSSSFNDNELETNSFTANDMSRLGVWSAQFIGAQDYIMTLGFDGDLIVQASPYERIRLAENVSSFTMSPDDHWIVTGHQNGELKFWELDAMEPGGSKPTFVWRGHDAAIVDIQFSHSAPILITEDDGGSARYWHQADPRLGPGVQGKSSADGRFLATTDLYENYYIWDLQADEPLAYPLLLDEIPIREITFSATFAATLHLKPNRGSGRLNTWNLKSAEPFDNSTSYELNNEIWIELAQQAHTEHPRMVPGAAWLNLLEHNQELWLVAGTYGFLKQYLQAVVRLDNVTDELTMSNSVIAPQLYLSVDINAAGNGFTTMGDSKDIELWRFDKQRSSLISTPLELDGNTIRPRYSPDNNWLIAGNTTKTALFEFDSAIYFELDYSVEQVNFTGQSSRLIIERDDVLKIHDLKSGQSSLLKFEPDIKVASLRLSKSGTDALIVDADDQLWWAAIPLLGSVATVTHLPPLAEPQNESWTAFYVGETVLAAVKENGVLVLWYRDDLETLSEPVVISEPFPQMGKDPTISISLDNEWLKIQGRGVSRVRPLSLDRLSSVASFGRD